VFGSGLRNILPITTAKVPIVKFEHRQSGLEGDISLYNTLVRLVCCVMCLYMKYSCYFFDFFFLSCFVCQAQHNTRMLAKYAAIDPRVQYLGYTMKVFAKVRSDISAAVVIINKDLICKMQIVELNIP